MFNRNNAEPEEVAEQFELVRLPHHRKGHVEYKVYERAGQTHLPHAEREYETADGKVVVRGIDLVGQEERRKKANVTTVVDDEE